MFQKDKHNYTKEGNSMAILTARCDKPFVVSADKSAEFMKQKRNSRTARKTSKFAAKFKENPNTKIEIGKLND